MQLSTNQEIPILVQEIHGIPRRNEPVTVGIPLKKGLAADSIPFSLWTSDGVCVPLQTLPLGQWSDGSIKWILLDFQVSVGAGEESCYILRPGKSPLLDSNSTKGISIKRQSDEIVIDTGSATFSFDTKIFKPFKQVTVDGQILLASEGSKTLATHSSGFEQVPLVDKVVIEKEGLIKSTLLFQGKIPFGQGNGHLEFYSRLSFFRNQSLVEIQFTVLNSKAATHPGGLWDLGDASSVYIRDLSIHVPLIEEHGIAARWMTTPAGRWESSPEANLEVYQDSSGGENWECSNHVNRHGKVMHSFQGYQVKIGEEIIAQGKRASPLVSLVGSQKEIIGAIQGFWQNFPKSLEVKDHSLIARMFPQQYMDDFELQGGEQKTHTLFLQFKQGEEAVRDGDRIDWIHHRLLPRSTPTWYSDTKVFPYVVPVVENFSQSAMGNAMTEMERLVQSAVRGPNSFFDRREIIDEFGWRNFGDLYADHEAVGYKGDKPLVAHYNNQYDVIYGGIVHYVRSGDVRWFDLSQDLAHHVIDIDIYHTSEDRPAYNGGLFWHTDHYRDAGTSTHRAFSKTNLEGRGSHEYGGGVSNEHNFTTGLLYYHYLTGDEAAKEAVKELADWVLQMDDGTHSKFSLIDKRPTGYGSSTSSRFYHGPGRGSGFSIDSLLDAYQLTQDLKYKRKAEELVQRCIHPHDDIASRGLDNIEAKWSYLVFLQVLGKYLDIKIEQGEFDYAFHYGRESLLHYANWMLNNEVPYKQVLHKVFIPTETWSAQDIRKSVVFALAGKYSEAPLRDKFFQKSKFFYVACIRDLLSFKTSTLTRPIVLLMTNGYIQDYFQSCFVESVVPPIRLPDFGKPRTFIPQLYEIRKVRGWVFKLVNTLQSIKQAYSKKKKMPGWFGSA